MYLKNWSLRKAFLSLLAILWNSVFKWVYLSFLLAFSHLFFSQLFVRLLQTICLLSYTLSLIINVFNLQYFFHFGYSNKSITSRLTLWLHTFISIDESWSTERKPLTEIWHCLSCHKDYGQSQSLVKEWKAKTFFSSLHN